MVSRKRRPVRRTEAGVAADKKALHPPRGAHVPVGFVSFAHAVAVTGIGKYRIGEAVKRAGVPVYRSPADARRKYIREEDVERLTAAVPEIPEPPRPPDAGGAEAPEAN